MRSGLVVPLRHRDQTVQGRNTTIAQEDTRGSFNQQPLKNVAARVGGGDTAHCGGCVGP